MSYVPRMHFHAWTFRYVVLWLFDDMHEINYKVCALCGVVLL